MSQFEYTAIPAPIRSEKAKSAKTPAERFALTLTAEINRMADEGWEYLRAETLPSEERSGLTGRTTLFHNLLIFRRPKAAAIKPRALTQAEAKPANPAPAAPAMPARNPKRRSPRNPRPPARRRRLRTASLQASVRPPRRFFRNRCGRPKSRARIRQRGECRQPGRHPARAGMSRQGAGPPAQCGLAPENRLMTITPAAIIAIPATAAQSRCWPRNIAPITEISAMPKPDQIA